MSQPNGNGPVCGRCGQVHDPAKCIGHVKDRVTGTWRPCRKDPMTGQRICDRHGGMAPQNRRAAKHRLEAAALERAVVTYGARREIGHLQALVELLHDSAGHVAWLRDIIRARSPEALVWGIADEVDKGSGEFPGVDVRKAAAPSVWLNEYHRERRVLLDVSIALARLGLDWDEREAVRKQGAVLARVYREGMRLMGHDPNDPAVGRSFSQALRSVAGPWVEPIKMIEGETA